MAEQLHNLLNALENLESALRRYQEVRGRRRAYVRREHVPFLYTRMKTFDEYLAVANPSNFKHYTGLTPREFGDLYEVLADKLRHPITHASPISGEQRLFAFLRFVGHGSEFCASAEDLHCGRTTLSGIIFEVARVIMSVLYPRSFPRITRNLLEGVALETNEKYDYPRAVGFMDGKHIYLKKPAHSGSRYFSYKKRCSIVLLAVVDCNCRFLLFDVGTPGAGGDAGVFLRSGIKQFFRSNDHVFPPTRELGNVGPVPYHILVDCGFAQGRRFVKPYARGEANSASRRRFNRKHSGARSVVERAFGLLRARFHILGRPMDLKPKRAMELVASMLVLHNWLRREDAEDPATSPESHADEHEEEVVEIQVEADARGELAAARRTREQIRSYYDNVYGALP